MAECRGKGIGGVEEGGHLVGGDVQGALQHGSHLLLAGGAVASNGHLDFAGFVLGDGHVAAQCGRHGHALGAPQFEHGLHVLAVERGLDGHLVGQELFDDAGHSLEDAAQAQVVVLHAVEFNHPHGNELGLLAVDAQQAISHDVGAWVDAYDDALEVEFAHGCEGVEGCGSVQCISTSLPSMLKFMCASTVALSSVRATMYHLSRCRSGKAAKVCSSL